MTKMALDAPYDSIYYTSFFFLLILITEQQFLHFLMVSEGHISHHALFLICDEALVHYTN